MGMIRDWLRRRWTASGAVKVDAPPSRADAGVTPGGLMAWARARWPKATGPVDPLLLGVVVALIAFGVVMVFSASSVLAQVRYHDGHYFLVRQGIFACAGVAVMLLASRIDYHWIRPFTYPILMVAVALLSYVALGFGHRAGGAARWIAVGPVHIQPAELAKVAMLLWLSYSLSKKQEAVRTFTIGVLPHVLMAGFLGLLCMRQPDFGSAVMIGVLTLVLLGTAGAKIGPLAGLVLLGAGASFVLVASSPYRMRRVEAFLDPFGHRRDEGYQVAESLLSFGSGGTTGLGIGESRQKMFFLPEAHTDFISATIGEELGFVGIACLVATFMWIVLRGIRAALRAPDDYGTFLAVGISMFIGLQAVTNLAVAMGMVPTKGLVLPFVSYGGSSLLVNAAAMGVLLNISRHREGADEDAPSVSAPTPPPAAVRRRTTRPPEDFVGGAA